MSDNIALLGKKFKDSLKNLDRKWRTNAKDKGSDIITYKGIQFSEYEGYGHFKIKCPNFLKKQKLGLSITWSKYDNDSNEENASKVMLYIGKKDDEGESSDEDLSDEEITTFFMLLITKWEEACIDIYTTIKVLSTSDAKCILPRLQ